ncbi:AraC family transcriptional regulator [Trabulsiella guamensis ATCC 49490]|uniref:AraC family transcriptional regulator n=1 Tax=Trabulsiella guamensis ATCC 49490 TaxID=1005994 RepID=A0A085AB60_9ENTR|nr:AraC family transcriptional regulator [Trabulsiella guamensis]KFC07455.1 AraC family transcriptional regulator [Trabulsiella guamensis ATCC 49490]
MTSARDINQRFLRPAHLPWAELRSTQLSRQAYKRHQHAALSIGAIIEGETCCVCEGQEYRLRPGDIIVIPPHVAHSCNPVASQPRSYHMLYLDVSWCLAQFAPATSLLTIDQPVIRDTGLFARYQEIVALMDAPPSPLLASRLTSLFQALPLIPAPPSRAHYASQQLSDHLLSNLHKPLALDVLANTFALRKETLIRLFRQDTGLTPGAFLNIARIEYAKSRLRAGEDIADVSYQSGFADQSHFHKTFVSYTAATPRQYARGRSISDNN